jgi:hypothetical protein
MTITLTQVNLEDKGALAKLVEADRTNYNTDLMRFTTAGEGNSLGLKSVAHIAKLEKVQATVHH